MLELLLELVLNGFGELILDLLGATKADRHPVGRAIVWTICGVVLGALSTFVFKQHFIHDELLRQWNLALAPLLVGVFSGLVASGRRKAVWSSAIAAAFFALAFAVTRYQLAQ